jgi:hypothetical protein
VEPKGLFEILNSKKALEDEGEAEDSELKYLRIIQGIRDKKPDLFEKVRNLPRKARSYRQEAGREQVLTYFRKG